MAKASNAIPVIDIDGFLNGTEAQKAETARLVDRTNREVGFLLITGHGISRKTIQEMFDVSRDFFEGPASVKQAVAAPMGRPQGYHGLGLSGLAAKEGQQAPPDIREYFMVGRLDIDAAYFSEGEARQFYQPNRWPDGRDDFRKKAEDYYRAMELLGGKLMQLFARALGLETDFFADKIDRHFSIFSSIYYPEQTVPPEPGQLRAGAHTDYGALTILAPTRAPGGLEVKGLDGNWIEVPYVPEAFVINIGDMTQRWTNDCWKSNMHRVVNPPPSQTRAGPRQSLAYFLHPNYDAVVEAIPETVPKGETPKYPAILAGQYMREKEDAIESVQAKTLNG